jgi:hypothetical protein
MQNEAIGSAHHFVPNNRLAAIGLADGHAVKHVWHCESEFRGAYVEMRLILLDRNKQLHR